MANKYLDLTGVETLWSAIKRADDSVKTDLTVLINGIKASSGSSVGYNSETKQMFLKDSEGKEIENSGFDASVFVKDGVLENVEIIETSETIKVTYGKDAEGNDVIYDGVNKAKFIEFSGGAPPIIVVTLQDDLPARDIGDPGKVRLCLLKSQGPGKITQ